MALICQRDVAGAGVCIRSSTNAKLHFEPTKKRCLRHQQQRFFKVIFLDGS